MQYTKRQFSGVNVVAKIPGESEDTILYSAHHDHLGIGPPDASGDVIYNGAVRMLARR